MTDAKQDKVRKLHENRAKAETELQKLQEKVQDAVENKDRRVRVERLVISCDEAMTKLFAKHEQLFELAGKTEDPSLFKQDLETWLNEVTTRNDEILKKAREYIDQCPLVDRASQSSTTVTKSKQPSKTSTAKTSRQSRTSSQRQRDLLIAKQRKEEIERQNEAALRIAKQQQELELERLQEEQELLRLRTDRLKKEQALRVEQLEEENRKKLAEATLTELELTENLSDSQSDFLDTVSQLAASTKTDDTARVSEWVNNSPVATASDPTNTVILEPNVVIVTTAAQNSVNRGAPTATPTPSFPVVTPVTHPTATTTNNMHLASGQGSVVYLPNTGHVQVPQSTTTSQGTNAPSIIATTSAPLVSTASYPISTVTVPASHILPNLSAWTFPTGPSIPHVSATPVTTNHTVIPTVFSGSRVATTAPPIIPVTAGGTVYYPNPTSLTTVPAPSSAPVPTTFPAVLPTATPLATPPFVNVPQPATNSFTVQDLAQLLASSKRDHLPEWKLAQYSGDPLQWHEWFDQFKSAIDSAPLTDDVKLTYLKTLMSGKAKTAIAEFAYCGTMYKDALKTLERKFGQPQTVVSAYLDKLANYPPVKMHNSDSIISYSATVSSLVGVFRSLNYLQDLSSASLLGQAVHKLPPNLKEAWSMNTIKRNLDRPTLIHFNDWLKEKAEAHERMKAASSKPRSEEVPVATVTKTKTGTKVFAATTSNQGNGASKVKKEKQCVACKENHPLWRCAVFRRKTPTERTKLAAESKLCFSCLNEGHSFRQCPQPRKCTKDGCSSSHNTLLHGSERIFPQKNPGDAKNSQSSKTTQVSQRQTSSESSGMPSVTDVKGLLQITEVELTSPSSSAKILALCDSACSHSWISRRLADKLQVKGSATKLTVHGINSQQLIDTETVELKLTPVHSGGSCSSFPVTPYVRDDLKVGNDIIDVDKLKTTYPHLEPIPLSKYSYSDVEMILGQDVFHCIRPLEYFEADRPNTPIAVRSPLGWVLSGPLPSTTGLFSTCFKAVTSSENDSILAEQLRSWYDMVSYGAYKQVDSRSAADARAMKILEETTFNDGCRYQVGMLWAEEESMLPNNYFSALVQLKSLERRLGKDPQVKESYSKTIREDFEKGYIVRVDKSECFRTDNRREWYLPHHPVVHPHKPGKVRRVLNGAAKFHGHSLNNALLTGPDLLQSLIHILFRFRQFPKAVSADIEGMFLQVGVIPKDQPSLRFLWREDPSTEVAVFQYVRHIFGSKDSPTCSNYALKRTATDNVDKFPKAAQSVQTKFYMDDYLESSPTADEATQKAKDLVKLLSLGGFNLTKFVSNDRNILQQIEPNSERQPNDGKQLPTTEESSHVLGLKWNHDSDTLVFSRGIFPDTN